MSDHAFTPGPWKATPNGYGVWFVHGGPDLFQGTTGTQYRDLVCGGNSHDTLTEANARLIAAAPELYAALKGLMKYHMGGERGFKGQCCFETDAAIDALRKAEGESA